MTADEIRTMPKGEFVVMRTGKHPIKVHYDLYLDWGIHDTHKNWIGEVGKCASPNNLQMNRRIKCR